MSNKHDPAAAYRAKAHARIEKARQEKGPVLPDLASAGAFHDPQTAMSNPRGAPTLSQLAGAVDIANKPNAKEEPKQKGLSPQTITLLEAVAAENQKIAQESPRMESVKSVDEAPEPVEKKTEDRPKPIGSDPLAGLDELEFAQLLRNIQQDVLNNEEERRAIEALVEPVDIAEALGSGSIEQRVPIVKGKLEVTYRSITGYENQQLRVLLFDMLSATPRLDPLADDIFYLLTLACSIVQVNARRMPEHMEGEGYERTFNAGTVQKKYAQLLHYPGPILHSLGIHSSWFDRRVRESLKVKNLKNG